MRVLLFAQTREAVGASELEITVPTRCGMEDLWQVLIAKWPELAMFRPGTRLARNGEYANLDTVFHDSDEVALIPPVSGG